MELEWLIVSHVAMFSQTLKDFHRGAGFQKAVAQLKCAFQIPIRGETVGVLDIRTGVKRPLSIDDRFNVP